jgi:hypothetical protein
MARKHHPELKKGGFSAGGQTGPRDQHRGEVTLGVRWALRWIIAT